MDSLQLIKPETLAALHAPQIAVGTDLSAPTPNAAYGMGWFVDTYNGRPRISHGGYLHDVNSEVSLFPEEKIGIVSFINFGCPGIARLINQQVFDLLCGLEPIQTLEDQLARYEKRIVEARERRGSTIRIENTSPSHALDDYAGVYEHPAYGEIEIRCDTGLTLHRGIFVVPLEHWHYDAWVAKDNDQFWIHAVHTFERANRILSHTNADGVIASVSIQLEPTVDPIRSVKQCEAPV